MAAFKRGDRARIAGGNGVHKRFIGKECTFLCYGSSLGKAIMPPDDCCVLVDGLLSQEPDGSWAVSSASLRKLTDPGAESFIARIKKLGSEPVNDAPKVTVREGK